MFVLCKYVRPLEAPEDPMPKSKPENDISIRFTRGRKGKAGRSQLQTGQNQAHAKGAMIGP